MGPALELPHHRDQPLGSRSGRRHRLDGETARQLAGAQPAPRHATEPRRVDVMSMSQGTDSPRAPAGLSKTASTRRPPPCACPWLVSRISRAGGRSREKSASAQGRLPRIPPRPPEKPAGTRRHPHAAPCSEPGMFLSVWCVTARDGGSRGCTWSVLRGPSACHPSLHPPCRSRPARRPSPPFSL